MLRLTILAPAIRIWSPVQTQAKMCDPGHTYEPKCCLETSR